MTIKPFAKIFHIGENYIENLFEGQVEITEKIDGSQWAFGIDEDGQAVKRSKGQDLTFTDIPKMFKIATEQTERMTAILMENGLKDIYFYCEFLSKPHHNILNYEKVPKNNLYLFGVMEGQNFVSDLAEINRYADMLDIQRPNLLCLGIIKDIKELESILEHDSCLGNGKIEGIVVKNYKEPVFIGSRIISISMGKYVREEFKEKHQSEWGRNFTSKGKLETFLLSFKTEARWAKSIQHLREQGELENAPRDIGKLIKEIKQDIIEEEKENIKNELYKIFSDDVLRRATRGFPEFYKEKLLKNSFTEPIDK